MSTKNDQKEQKFFKEVPDNEVAWVTAANRAGVTRKHLNEWDNLKSGSKVTHSQFLLFRTIIKKGKPVDFMPKDFNLADQIKKARELLDKSGHFQSYLTAVQAKKYTAQGYFAPLQEQQQELFVNYADMKKKKFKGPTNYDEAPVNSTFINFLKALASVLETREYIWRYSRGSFKAKFQSSPTTTGGTTAHVAKRARTGEKEDREYIQIEEHGFTAITDGQFQHSETYRVKIIVECKRAERKECIPAVDMQEAAQMVAWVLQYPSKERQRAVIAQNGKEIYITIVKFNDGYVNYLNGKAPASSDMMTMYQFGPSQIDCPIEIKMAAQILLALHL